MSDSHHTHEHAHEPEATPAPVEAAPATPVAAPMVQAPRKSLADSLGIPVAIVLAGALVGGAIYMSGLKSNSVVDVQNGVQQAAKKAVVPPVTGKDMIRGNPNAPIKIVEYSDYDCPFCKIFHDTMNKVMADYAQDGKVAWVYRHSPIRQLHPNAPKIATAAKCVTELGGNTAFWKFTDAVFESRKYVTNANGQQSISFIDMTKLHDFATQSGVDGDKYDTCFSSGKYDAEVTSDVQAAANAGAQGTPYSVVFANGDQGVINGAQPYEVVKGTIDDLLSKVK